MRMSGSDTTLTKSFTKKSCSSERTNNPYSRDIAACNILLPLLSVCQSLDTCTGNE